MELIGALFFVLVIIGLGLFMRRKIQNSYAPEPSSDRIALDKKIIAEMQPIKIEELHVIGG